MKKLFIFAMCAIALASCNEGAKKAEAQARAERDSLNQVIAQKDDEINDMMTTLIDIEEGFREITEAQGRVQVAKRGEGASSAGRIKENMQFIQSTMQQNRELINKLRNQLRQSSMNGEQLRRTIDNFTRQMEEKDVQLKQLQADLVAKDVQIGELSEQVVDLNSNISTLQEESTKKTQTITSQDKQLNTAWFVYGTKKELKEQRIYDDGKVLQNNFNRDYFTKIDIRVDKEIRLYSRSAKILTAHPASSYVLTQDANKQYILRISNPQLFWSTSKYLVVMVK